MDKELEKLLQKDKLSENEAEALQAALEESKAGDEVLLSAIRKSRSQRRVQTVGTAVSVFFIALALGVLFYATTGQSAPTYEKTVVEISPGLTGADLDRMISNLEQQLRKPGKADSHQQLANAYSKRFQITGDKNDLLKASEASQRALVLIRKNPKEVVMKMNTALFTLVFAFLVLGVLGVVVMFLYNGLVKRDENVDARWAQVETVLQRRLDLVPQLVETVKGYAKHESETLLGVTEARNKLSKTLEQTGGKAPTDKAVLGQLDEASANLGTALGKLMMLVENYPDLKANQNFLSLQDQLEGTENRISVERGRYNDAVRSLNTTLRSFPHNVFGASFGFEAREYFQSKVGAEEAVQVQF